MKEVLLSDWTLAAFMQRDEERRRKEQTEAAVISPNKEMLRSTGPLRSEWTIAALQQRFAALEQRIANLEQIVGEQRRKEQVAAAGVAPREETPGREELLLTCPTLVTPNVVAPNVVDQQARFAAAKIEDARVEAAGPAGEQRWNRSKPEIIRLDARGRLEGNPIEARPDEANHVKRAHKKAHRFVSFIITALTAGAVGFGAAINVVPIEKATHFRALAKHGFASILGAIQLQ
jgi:hypothetical protein